MGSDPIMVADMPIDVQAKACACLLEVAPWVNEFFHDGKLPRCHVYLPIDQVSFKILYAHSDATPAQVWEKVMRKQNWISVAARLHGDAVPLFYNLAAVIWIDRFV